MKKTFSVYLEKIITITTAHTLEVVAENHSQARNIASEMAQSIVFETIKQEEDLHVRGCAETDKNPDEVLAERALEALNNALTVGNNREVVRNMEILETDVNWENCPDTLFSRFAKVCEEQPKSN